MRDPHDRCTPEGTPSAGRSCSDDGELAHSDSGIFDLAELMGPRPTFPPRWAELAPRAETRRASARVVPLAVPVVVLTLMASALVSALALDAPEPMLLGTAPVRPDARAMSIAITHVPAATVDPSAIPSVAVEAPASTAVVATRAAAAPTGVATAARPPVFVAQDWETGARGTAPTLDRSLDTLLDQALGDAPADPRPTGPVALPETPTAHQVATTLRALSGEVAECREVAGEGALSVQVAVHGPSGTVSSVSVRGAPDAATRACVADVVESAHFPRFTRERFVITYPY